MRGSGRGQADGFRAARAAGRPRLAPAGWALLLAAGVWRLAAAGVPTPVPPDQRGRLDAERSGVHDASNIRTIFWNYGMVGDYPPDPGNVDLSVFHSVEVPKGSGMNYSDGITPFVLARIIQRNGVPATIMETGFRERQAVSAITNRQMRFEPRPGYLQADPALNPARSPAVSSDDRTWPPFWPDRLDEPDDPGWAGSWNGYFGKQVMADQESYMVMDDQAYDAWDFRPDSRDSTRLGLGLRIEARGFQWANPQSRNVIFWHYDITNESTTDYNDNIVFGLYMDSGVGGSQLSCDGIYESDDDNAFFDRTNPLNGQIINLVYTWDLKGHGRDLTSGCARTGYLGYAYLETPGNPLDGVDNDLDGITDERRDGGPGELVEGLENIVAAAQGRYDVARFEATYGPIAARPAAVAGRWWTGDEDMDWVAEVHDVGADGKAGTGDTGEGDGIPTEGEPNFDRTDLHESDQIGLTGFKINRIAPGQGNEGAPVDGILFFPEGGKDWPQLLYDQFSSPDPNVRFGPGLATNYNIAFLFASGPFTLRAGQTERFSLALAYGADLSELRRTVQTVQTIYNANYRFAVPPSEPTVTAETGDGFVRLSWDDIAEQAIDPVTGQKDFEGYRIYRSTDPDFRDPQVIFTGTGSGPIYNGRPIAQFDLIDGVSGFSTQTVEGVAFYLGTESGVTHQWTDHSVTNGQEYYYGVCAYDYGADPPLNFPPSENDLSVNRTPRGGVVLPSNIVRVRPDPPAAGFRPAAVDTARHAAGRGDGTVEVRVVNSSLVSDGHVYRISFSAPDPDSIRASRYTLTDTAPDAPGSPPVVLFDTGRDFRGQGTGAIGGGLLPVITMSDSVTINQSLTGMRPGSPTNVRVTVSQIFSDLNYNLRRPGYPDDISIVFSDAFEDTSVAYGAQWPPLPVPAKFKVIAHSPAGDQQLDFRFRDGNDDGTNRDGTLSRAGEQIDIVTYAPGEPGIPKSTWRVRFSGFDGTTIRPPAAGDVIDIVLKRPFSVEDVFTFTAHGAVIDPTAARVDFSPYVVPNPYVGSASFEPERFAISGRGERRLE
ncbi:MAG: hypothetical protein ACYDIE_11145, partial [Candidatus Krumholzibacteriia bacterium]